MVIDSFCMQLHRPCERLQPVMRSIADPREHEVLLKVSACAVCRTDLHLVDGELPDIPSPIVPGHQIVGEVIERGSTARWDVGSRVGVPWLAWTDGVCDFCRSGRENLCDHARFTGYQVDGGYAQHVLADSRYCFALPDGFDDAHAAPLLCGGLIGFRALRMTNDAKRIGIYGFGASAHIITQVARWEGRDVFAFTRAGDQQAQTLALELGAAWAGDSTGAAPIELDAAIIFAPVGELVPLALRAVRKGGIVVCGGIHMSDIPQFAYSLLWGERSIRSVANLTRRDGEEFLSIAPHAVRDVRIESFPLRDANEALNRLRTGKISGAAVLVPDA